MTVEEYNSAVDLHSDSLYRFILKNLQDEAGAQDIVQESFEKLWIRLEEVEGSKAKSYLFTTAYHAMIDQIRKSRRMTRMEKQHYSSMMHDEQYSDLKEVLSHALTLLPDDQRSVLMLRDYEGYSYQEIGEITGLNESQVKVYIYRARTFLKNFIVDPERVL
ncbi:MAG: RNA polymerase sigma factor [Bacteroidota bacterium]